jgi:hypothetical protein
VKNGFDGAMEMLSAQSFPRTREEIVIARAILKHFCAMSFEIAECATTECFHSFFLIAAQEIHALSNPLGN